ncbi:glycosyltransferase family 4 protein [Paeniglutamicibacter sp. R2-26]|uniref:glycosyltransferase family 4 protein n=1 Tax=Paeniglutamicibacter sp. R2-26 TaxID=3144417 RepID=UPI003EE6538A
MKVLIYPHDLHMGGSQLNALDLAAGLRDKGHEVVVYGQPGELVARIHALGLEYIESPRPSHRPTPGIVADLRRVAIEREMDVLHGFEWPPSLECRLAGWGLKNTASISTVMSMSVANFIPRDMPLTVGTEQIMEERIRRRYGRVTLLEPPVDEEENTLDAAAGSEFRRQQGIPDDVPMVAVVSRLVPELKLEGIVSAIRAMGLLRESRDIRLVVVGDGPALGEVRQEARLVNQRYPGTVILAGAMSDPRPAYSAADVMLGMGGSALKSLSFGKPLIVQGEGGYWKAAAPENVGEFFWQGWYGVGTDAGRGPVNFAAELELLLADPARLEALGTFGRGVIEERYSITAAVSGLEELYRGALADTRQHPGESLRASLHFVRYQAARVAQRIRRRAAADDFNVDTVAARGPAGPRQAEHPPVVYVPGTFWSDIKGTDHMLATALSKRGPVIWIDPPRTLKSALAAGTKPSLRSVAVESAEPGITRVWTQVPAGVSIPALRNQYDRLSARAVRRIVARQGLAAPLIVHSSATAGFPKGLPGTKVLYVTDDWVAGEQLMGLPAGSVERRLAQNIAVADVVLAVSPGLVDALGSSPARPRVRLLPNGCHVREMHPPQAGRADVALLGQLNDRLDLSLLEVIRDSGFRLQVAGPVRGKDAAWKHRMMEFLESEGVEWAGEIDQHDVSRFLSKCAVGLTPYAASPFNEASFPLKTLDYLAAGIPVVSTDLPASRWFESVHVRIGRSSREIVELLAEAQRITEDPLAIAERHDLAAANSWDKRTGELLRLSTDDVVLRQ